MALFNAGEPRREDNYPYCPDLYTREVMVTLYKIEANFIPAREVWDPDPSPYVTMRTDYAVRDRRGWVFERERWQYSASNSVEVKVYNAAIAAISRAFARLEKRGLVKRVRRDGHRAAGIVLTPVGYQEALAQLKFIDPDRYQRVMSILNRKSNG